MCVCVCVCVCVSLGNDSWETLEVIVVKFGMVTTPDMRMHDVLIMLTVAVIQCHIDLF